MMPGLREYGLGAKGLKSDVEGMVWPLKDALGLHFWSQTKVLSRQALGAG